jgi:hypothetical protein
MMSGDAVSGPEANETRTDAAQAGLGAVLRFVVTIPVLGMLIAVFLPWSIAKGVGYGLAEYAAATPSLVAWLTISLGLAVCIVGTGTLWFGNRLGLMATIVGALAYATGALIYYGSTVLPSVVATGCTGNPGTLCSQSIGTPTIADAAGVGFVIAIIAAATATITAVIGLRVSSRTT